MTDYFSDAPPEPEQEQDAASLPMEPLQRSALAPERRSPLDRPRLSLREMLAQAEEEREEAPLDATVPMEPSRTTSRDVDPLFAYIFLVAIAVGLSTLEATVTYVLLWTLMGGLGAMGYLLGTVERMRNAQIDDLIFGIVFGFLSSFPFLLVFGSSLEIVSVRMFDVDGTPNLVMDTWVFMAVAFVIPASETLFFRGAVQTSRGILITTVLATVWTCVLFFPNMALGGREVIGLILIIVFVLLNFMYSYVRHRNGLAGAWLCQAVSYPLLWFFPRILF